MSVVRMETDRVRDMADWFDTASGILHGVSNAMEILMNTLRTTALIGLVGGAAVERYLAAIQPRIESLAEFCEEMNKDLTQAVSHFENGDAQGASRFY